jgi:hypothetical protein
MSERWRNERNKGNRENYSETGAVENGVVGYMQILHTVTMVMLSDLLQSHTILSQIIFHKNIHVSLQLHFSLLTS